MNPADVKCRNEVVEDHHGKAVALTADLPTAALAVRILHHESGQVEKPVEIIIKGGSADVVVALSLEEANMLSQIFAVLYENGLVYRNVMARVAAEKRTPQ